VFAGRDREAQPGLEPGHCGAGLSCLGSVAPLATVFVCKARTLFNQVVGDSFAFSISDWLGE